MSPDIPRIRAILNILLPMMFPKTTSLCPDMLEKIFTINSGADVPKATIVRPITISGTFALFAREAEPSTRKSAPFISKRKPPANTTISISRMYHAPSPILSAEKSNSIRLNSIKYPPKTR